MKGLGMLEGRRVHPQHYALSLPSLASIFRTYLLLFFLMSYNLFSVLCDFIEFNETPNCHTYKVKLSVFCI